MICNTIFLINGTAYKSDNINLYVTRYHDCDNHLECQMPTTTTATIKVKKAKIYSGVDKCRLLDIISTSQIITIELMDLASSLCGDFHISSLRKHKKGSLSFEAELTGEFIHTVL